LIIQNEWSYKIAHFKKCDSIENMTQLKMTSTIAIEPQWNTSAAESQNKKSNNGKQHPRKQSQ